MAINEEARRNHDELFPGHVSTLKVTDAEPEGNVIDELNAAYRAKYRRYSAGIVNSIVSPEARSATVKVIPS
jgi:hypothetical protein